MPASPVSPSISRSWHQRRHDTAANYARNTMELDDAINQLQAAKGVDRAIVMVATTRQAAKFIEKTRDLFPG